MEKTGSLSDVPKLLPVFILLVCFISIFINVMLKNPAFLTSQTGYVNGGCVNQHFLEAKYLKDLLQNGTTNFWFPGNSLGYPMYITLQPLPSAVTALAFMLFERFATPLCIFRWLLVLLVALIPISWYRGLRLMNISRAESLMAGLLFLVMNSQHQNGFEVSAYLKEGLIPQLYAQCLFPFAVSSVYSFGTNKMHTKKAVYFLCLVYLCNAFTGLYCSIISFITKTLSRLINRRSSTKEFQEFFVLHLKVTLYLSWLIIPCLISYPYIGGGASKRYGGFSLTYVVDMFNNGLLFDCKRDIPWLTILVSVGIVLSVKHIMDYTARVCSSARKKNTLQNKQQEMYAWWLVLVTAVSCFFYMNNPLVNALMNVMPFDLDFDNKSFIVGLHFCGALMAGRALHWIANLNHRIKYFSSRVKRVCKMAAVLIVSLVFIKSGLERINQRLSMIEMSEEFVETLNKVKIERVDRMSGRMLTHSQLGTGGSWDMSNIPILTGKPGAVSYSLGWDDSLSAFYINSIPFGGVSVEDLKPLFRLYNIQYVAASTSFVDDSFEAASFLKPLHTVDDLVFYEVVVTDYNDEDSLASYFDFVRLPGHIDGKLKSVRETVMESLPLYTINSMFYLNPRQSSLVRRKGVVNAQVMDVSYQKPRSSEDSDVSLVTWKLNNKGMSSEAALKQVEMLYDDMDIESKVIEQNWNGLEYHAIVEVVTDDEFVNLEHLLLKVSYHPFWRCVYFPVNDRYTLQNDANLEVIPRNRSSVTVDHVTPNFISVTLPAGRYHVVFRYRTPGILKLMLVVCIVLFANNSLHLSLFTRTAWLVANVWELIEMYQIRLLFKSIQIVNSLYYRSLGIALKHTVRRLSAVHVYTAQLDKREEISGWLTNIMASCKERFVSLTVRAPTQSRKSPSSAATKQKEPRSEYNDVKLFPCKDKERASTKADEYLTKCDVHKSEEDGHGSKGDNNVSKAEIHSSDHDSSFCSDVFIVRSPPTPPKHMKKSYRKRSARSASTSDEGYKKSSTLEEGCKKPPTLDEDYKKPSTLKEGCKKPAGVEESLFQTKSTRRSTSPVLGNILESLRRNSLSPRKNLSSPRIEKFSPTRPAKKLLAVKEPEKSARLETPIPDQLPSTVCNSASSSVNIEINKDQNNSFGSNGGECEWDDLLFDSYSSGSNMNDSSSNSKDGVLADTATQQGSFVRNEIEIDKLVSTANDHDNDIIKANEELDSLELSLEDSFSPRSSSSPELSLSPERFSGSPDGHSSPDNSFEFTAYSNNNNNNKNHTETPAADKSTETVLKSEIYRIYMAPESPKEVNKNSPGSSRRNTMFDPVQEEISRLQRKSPARRATTGSTFEEYGDDGTTKHSPLDRLRRRRGHNVSFD